MSRPRPTILVVAAGSGRRFLGGVHKLAQPLGGPGGSTVLGRTLRQAVATQLPVLVVTTQEHRALAAGQVAGRDILVLPDAEAARGMGHSIAAGVAERSGSPGWLVLPGDMPLLRPGTLLAVAAALEHHAVVFAQHQGRRGHPVGFGAELYSELVRLDGDDGARRITLRYPALGLEVDDPGVLMDVDTVADLERVQAALAGPAAVGKG
jgi:molybdenum cofactor cytidylyltransferase